MSGLFTELLHIRCSIEASRAPHSSCVFRRGMRAVHMLMDLVAMATVIRKVASVLVAEAIGELFGWCCGH